MDRVDVIVKDVTNNRIVVVEVWSTFRGVSSNMGQTCLKRGDSLVVDHPSPVLEVKVGAYE